IVQMQAASTEASTEAVSRWGAGSAISPWSKLAGDLFKEFDTGGMAQSRFMAIYHTAMHDAAIAAWDAQVAYERPGPAAADERITPATGVDPERSSFPSDHAAIAGAAAVVLAYLLPDAAAGRFDDLAMEAAESRLAAGAAFRSDIEAGLALGQAVGERAVARAKGDGSDQKWDPSTRPTGPGFWEPAPPAFIETPVNPLAGSWKTWVMTSGDQFRPAAPPAYGSPAWKSEVEAVAEIVANRSFEEERLAAWWAGSSPVALFSGWINELASRAGLDGPHTAKILADTYVATADAVIAVWDAKYTWWTSRPITEVPELKTVVPTPPYPAYPSGYSTVMGSAATVVGHYFPEAADDMNDRAWEAAASRCWAGIHYVIDDDIGLLMGRQVGRLVCSLDRAGSA
ncbi:MAG TPA: phosphatase PAP2 family protein, partial [Gemmatimonadales bacterium]|nr:phosphatase PAP2 family protein [Gemmatimonadales bacterium]